MDLQLTGKRALVTGASRGIGKAVVAALVAEGAHVGLISRNGDELEAVAAELARDGSTLLPLPADTTSTEAVDAAVARMVDELGGVDVLVNAAATPASSGSVTPFLQFDEDAFRAEIDTKVLGYLRTARAVAPHMIEQGWGRIINVSGMNARLSGALTGSVRNVAVSAFTKNLADELGPHGITVTVVHPGMTLTERSPGLFERLAQEQGSTAEQVQTDLAARTSSHRLTSGAEVADVIAFLASPRSVGINGDAVAVGGGTRGFISY